MVEGRVAELVTMLLAVERFDERDVAAALLPLAPIRQVYVKIHPAIETKDQKISQVRAACFEAVNSGLPPYQQHKAAATDKPAEE